MPKGFFSPGINLLNKFKYSTKIGIISAVLILFIFGLFYLIIKELDLHIEATKKEKIGLEYIDPIKNLMQDISEHRALTNAYLNDDKNINENQITAINKKINEEINLVNKAQQTNNYKFKINKLWLEINNEWKNLENNSLKLTPGENYKRHVVLINKIIYLISYISDISKLVLDPSLNNFYLVRSVSRNLPELTENIAQARSFGVGALARKKISKGEKIFLLKKITLIQDSLRRININFQITFEKNNVLKERMERFLEDINLSTNHFTDLIDKEIIMPKEIIISPKDYYMAGTSSLNSTYRLYETKINILEDLLTERLKIFEQEKALIVIFLLITLSSIIYIFACFAYALLASLKTLEKTALSVSEGNLDAEAEVYSKKDELGSLSISFNNMIKNLKTLMQRELILRRIIISSLESKSANEILRSIVNDTGKIFKADRCFFINYDFKNKEFLPINPNNVYMSSLEFKNLAGRKLSAEEMEPFLIIWLQQKQILVINDVSKIIIPENTRTFIEEIEIKSSMAAPMFYAGRLIGILLVDYVKNLKEFSEDEKNLLETIANQSAIVINQAVLTERLQETTKREFLLRKIINNILTSENLEKALDLISEEIGKLFDAERVKIRNYNKEEGIFSEVIAEYRKNAQIPSLIEKGKYSTEVSEYITNILTKEKKPFIVNDVENSELPEYMKEFCSSLSTKSLIESPIFYKDKFLASIIIENTTAPKEWEQDKLDLLTPVCQQIAIGMNLFNLNEELKMSLVNEKIMREILIETKKFDDHDGIYNYLLSQLLNLFNPNRCIHLHHDEHNNLVVHNEALKDETLQPLLNQPILSAEYTHELSPEEDLQVNVVKDVNQEINSPKLREYLINNRIQAYLLYSTARICPGSKKNEVFGYTIICYSEPQKWTSEEIDFFKLIVDTVSIIFLEFKQRQETEEIKRTFIATLTHDLRSPIIAEQKALEAIISKKINYLNEHYDEYIEDIYKTNKSLLKIVNNLLSVYHYESEKPVLNKTETNIKELIEESIISLKYIAADKESQIYLDIPEDLPLINVDRDEITRVLSNLVGNAIKHTRKNTQIRVYASKEENNILIAVQDNGEGIPKEHIDMIFQRYPTEKRKVGTGLGLYLSKQIVEAHDGKIWFETQEGIGTTFYFTLPV